MIRTLLVVLLLSATGWARASDAENSYLVLGTKTCFQFVDERKFAPDVQDRLTEMWIAGYVSAVNKLTPDTFNILGKTNMKSLIISLENYCRGNPFAESSTGLREMIDELYPQRQKSGKEGSK